MKRTLTAWFDVSLNILCVVVLGVLGYGGLKRGGFVANAWAQWKAERETTRRIATEWPALARSSARLDRGSGSVQLVEFSDYQCPYCKQQHFVLEALVDSVPELGIAYRHLPNKRHPAARGAALAAICAERTGRFHEMHRLLFETIEWQVDTNWVELARKAGVSDLRGFGLCLGDLQTHQRLEEDLSAAQRLGITGTPGFVGRGGLASGLLPPGGLVRLARK